MPKLDLSNVEKLIASGRAFALQCKSFGVAGLLNDAADTLEQQAAEVLRLSKAFQTLADDENLDVGIRNYAFFHLSEKQS